MKKNFTILEEDFMKVKILLAFGFLFSLFFPALPSLAVDDTAANLVAEGDINLTQMIDALNHRYPKDKELFWNVSGIAYHDFTGTNQSDVIIGLSGYKDKGLVYNNEKQLVEDAGAAFAYFHKVGDGWKLEQVEEVVGAKYEGFEGADLIASGKDQLVVYTSTGTAQMATVYEIEHDGIFKTISTITGYGMGPRVSQEEGKTQIVDFQKALINPCDDCHVYYGRPYLWDGHKFVEQPDDFLDHVQSYDPAHTSNTEALQYWPFSRDTFLLIQRIFAPRPIVMT